jgi:hypothetical protein
VENAITKKITEGALKLDSFLGNLPKKVDLDSVAAMNVTFVNDPLFKSSSVEFDIDGLFRYRICITSWEFLENALDFIG